MKNYALVTGGADRIGKAVTVHLAQQNYNLVLHYNSSKEKAQKLKEELESIYADITVELLQINFLKDNDFDEIFTELKKKKITIDILVNCASDFIPSGFREKGSELLDKEMTINFMDIADKPSYVIVTKKGNASSGTWLFVILVLALLVLAVWFLWRKKNGGTSPPSASVPPVAPTSPTATYEQGEHEMNASVTAVPDEVVSKHKPTRGERFAQAISAAAVGVGSSAVGGGANHTVEEVLAHEEALATPMAHQPPQEDGNSDEGSAVQESDTQPKT